MSNRIRRIITAGRQGPAGATGPAGADGAQGPAGTPGSTDFPALTNKPFFDIRDFGAAVDGVTDDSAAVLAALNAAKLESGGVIFFPAGITRISTQVAFAPGAQIQGVYVFQGEGGRSQILFKQVSGIGFYLNNCSEILFRDLLIVGESAAGQSTGTNEATNSVIYTATVQKTVFERCWFLGLACPGANGVLGFNQTTLAMRDCFFGACTAPNSGVVFLDSIRGFMMDNVTFLDYHEINDIYYHKVSIAGSTRNWVRAVNTPALGDATQHHSFIMRNCRMDENTTDALVNLTGTAEKSAYLENCSFNGGFSFQTTLKFSTFREVEMKNCYNGLSLNTGSFRSALFTDIGLVKLDNLIHKYGAEWLDITGTTKRVKLRNCSLQGSVAYPLGINNTANALIDSDAAMPETASAAALAPLGMTTHVTGTTGITSITATNFKAGDVLTLIFDDALTVTDGGNMRLAGNFITAANSVLVLKFDGTNFYEQSRSAN